MERLVVYLFATIAAGCGAADHETKFPIDGRVRVVEDGVTTRNETWIRDARVIVDDGQHIGILR